MLILDRQAVQAFRPVPSLPPRPDDDSVGAHQEPAVPLPQDQAGPVLPDPGQGVERRRREGRTAQGSRRQEEDARAAVEERVEEEDEEVQAEGKEGLLTTIPSSYSMRNSCQQIVLLVVQSCNKQQYAYARLLLQYRKVQYITTYIITMQKCHVIIVSL